MSHDAQTIRLEIQSISSDSGSEALMADIVHEERDTPLRKTEETINENIVSSLPRRSLVRRRTEDWVRSSSECEPLHPRNPAKRIKLARQPAPVITSDVPTFPTTAATPGLTKTGKPLSMSKTAVDHRERKAKAEEYRERLLALIDPDITEQVEREGWITPEGRTYKAAVRMVQRLKEAREPDGGERLVDENLAMEMEELQRENERLRGVLKGVKRNLEGL